MAGDFLLRYFEKSECIVYQRRVSSLRYGQDSDRFVKFKGLKFGLSKGPDLDSLEAEYLRQERSSICGIIESEIQNSANSLPAQTRHPGGLKAVAYEAVKRFCFSDVLEPTPSESVERSLDSEKVFQVVGGLYQSIPRKILSDAFGDLPVLILQGNIYNLEEDSKDSLAPVLARIDKRWFSTSGLESSSIDSLVSDYHGRIKKHVQDKVKRNREVRSLRNLLPGFDEVRNCPEFYSAEHNLGFKRQEEGLWAYTWTPEYVLKEWRSGLLFRFPKAQVGVELIEQEPGNIKVNNPIVLNQYTHPAVPDIGKAMRHICFVYHERPDYDHLPAVEKIFALLRDGCAMLMSNFDSSGHTYHDIEIPKVRDDDFMDMVISADGLNGLKITNLKAAQRAEQNERVRNG